MKPYFTLFSHVFLGCPAQFWKKKPIPTSTLNWLLPNKNHSGNGWQDELNIFDAATTKTIIFLFIVHQMATMVFYLLRCNWNAAVRSLLPLIALGYTKKGVHLFKYFLHSMRTPQNNRNAYMHEDETIKVVYALSAGNIQTGVRPHLV